MSDSENIPFLRLARAFFKNPLWQENREYSKAECWLDLIATVSIQDEFAIIGMKKIAVKRGQSLKSTTLWSERWGMNKSKANRILDLFKNMDMIVRDRVGKIGRLTVCNYDTYNKSRNGSETKVKPKRNESETKAEQGKEYKEQKEAKEVKNKDLLLVLDYLNKKLNKKFRTAKGLLTRFEEGYTVEDAKTVIDKKTEEWKGTDMEKYLVPDTLFSGKFDKYLNQTITKKEQKGVNTTTSESGVKRTNGMITSVDYSKYENKDDEQDNSPLPF